MLAELQSAEDCVMCARIAGLAEGSDAAATAELISSVAAESPCLSISGLAVGGEELIKLGVQKGKQLGSVLRRLLDAVIEDPSLNERTALLSIAKRLLEETDV